jgi:hypothetical protein
MSDRSRAAKGIDSPESKLAVSQDFDPVIDAYKQGIDRTLLRENLRLTVEERFWKFEKFMEYVTELRRAGQRPRSTE